MRLTNSTLLRDESVRVALMPPYSSFRVWFGVQYRDVNDFGLEDSDFHLLPGLGFRVQGLGF